MTVTTGASHPTTADPPALRRLLNLERRRAPSVSTAGPMGYQPGLDGVRALSVVAVILYHGGISWLPGGFFGVEVFFVVSGFLITSLLLEEQQTSRRVSLRNFWLRRARRLLPALVVMLLAVATWAAFAGGTEQLSQLRRDLSWSIFYVGNWGQILGDVPYYSGDPPLLRHVWSLAVEEQWYLLWPLAFVAISRWSTLRRTRIIGAAALASMALTLWLSVGKSGPLRGPVGLLDGVDRVNFMYLSTPTRASGLLLGAAAAFVWRPWRRGRDITRLGARALDRVGAVGVVVLAAAFAFAHLTESYVYQWLLPLVTMASLVVIAVVVVPGDTLVRRTMSWTPLVEIGKRSYGLYLWHWPIFVIADATDGSWTRVVGALAVTAVVSELCYRFVETPVRRGALGRWWRSAAADRSVPRRAVALCAGAFLVVSLAVFYGNVRQFDAAEGGTQVTFDLSVRPATRTTAGNDAGPAPEPAETIGPDPTTDAGSDGSAAPDPTAVGPTPTVEPPTTESPPPPELQVELAIVGDSQAHSLAVNLPDGIESTFAVTDGSLDGCSVYDSGGVVSARDFNNDFGICAGWQQQWTGVANDADVVLVVLGAWDVFDLEIDGQRLTFGTPQWDAAFGGAVQQGIDAIAAGGARAAVLEVPCMRPIDVEGAGVPALPERGDDQRVGHVNDVLRGVVADNADTAAFVEGPDQWCNGSPESSETAYRWDGVHVYIPGANLVYMTIAPALVELARSRLPVGRQDCYRLVT